MPRVGDVMQLLSGTLAVPNTTIQSAPYNAQQNDWVLDANNPRPISAGGTGATTATAARTSLGAIGAGDLAAAPTKATVVDTDSVVIIDSVAPDVGKNKRWLVSALKASLATMTDTPFKLVSTDATATAGPQLRFDRLSPTPAADDALGYVSFLGRNSAAELVTYAYIQSGIVDPINAQEGGSLLFSTMNGSGGLASSLSLNNGNTTVHHNLGVLGTATFNGAATFTVAPIFDSSPTINGNLLLVSTDGLDTSGPILTLDRRSPSASDNDTLADIRFQGRNSGNTPIQYASIYATITDASAGTEDGSLVFRTMTAASVGPALTLGPTMATLYKPLTLQNSLSSSTTTLRLCTTGAGNIYLQPNGVGSSSGQAVVSAAGNFLTDGNITAGSGYVQSATTVLRLCTTGAGNIFLQPNGNGSSVGQAQITSTGHLNVDGNVNAGSGYFLGTTDTHFANTGTGTMMTFHPVSSGSSAGQMTLSAAGNLTTTGGVISNTGFFYTTTGDTVVAAGTGGGFVAIRPAGTGSSTGALRLTSTTLGVFGDTGAARGALALPTGTIQRTTYATSSVTLPQLAGVVMAIITDLKAMGFFS